MVDNILQMSLPYTEVKNNQQNNFYYNLFKNKTNAKPVEQTLNMPKANHTEIKMNSDEFYKEFSFSK